MVWLQSLRVLALILLWAPWRSHGLITTKSPHALVHMDSFKRPPFSRLVRRPAAGGSAGGDDAEIEGEPPSSVEESAAPSAWPWAEPAAGLAAGLASEVGRRLGEANALEVRLDLTILWCHVLARGLVGEILTRPLKQVPGITPDDLAILLSLVSSASVISFLWCLVGALLTGQFQSKGLGSYPGARGSELDDLPGYLAPTVATCAVAGPLWIAADYALKLDGVQGAGVSPAASAASALLGLLATTTGARILAL
eukprot:CAMPEP_0172648070 /NCGR_PEP_ID=MMETSP1068-20121228/241080_1 /TAXON_ID=35684 /ORGANISM="Pseudopedinella elastica, Strain CCMP716" /LENGTH=253 /DNA_ID=CAMNT_0013462375 /DNA_START=113 /DNA_END=874 /DNA_ORIENTATION=+